MILIFYLIRGLDVGDAPINNNVSRNQCSENSVHKSVRPFDI